MVKRSRVYCTSSSGGSGGGGGGGGGVGGAGGVVNRRQSVVVTVVLLALYILLCGGGAVLGTSLGAVDTRSMQQHAAERVAAAVSGRYADEAPRNGRATAVNLSHITGTARKIKMFIKNRYLQVFPDGTVNGTAEDTSDYVILQRTSVNMGQLKIQGVATCMYLCMDACGLLYGSKDFEEDCVFNEMIEKDQYNTYSSAKYTNDRRTLYLALNKRGTPRKVQVKANAPLGKQSTYTRVLTQQVPAQRVEELLANRQPVSGEWPASVPHGHRHHHVCPPHVGPPHPTTKHRKASRKCLQAKGGGGAGGPKKFKEDVNSNYKDRGGGVSIEDEDCGGNKNNNSRCGAGAGADEVSHRKADAAGRKRKSKKTGAKADRHNGKSKKAESEAQAAPAQPPPPEPAAAAAAVVVHTVTTVVAPLQFADEDNDDDDDVQAPPAAATAPTDEFLAPSNDN